MRSYGLPIAMAALLATGGSAAAQPEGRHAGATLMPRSLHPLQLEGSGFKRRERVRVTVTPTGRAGVTKRVRARRDGAFSIAFARVPTCDGIEAVALGRRGSRASFQLAAVGCPAP
jgi:hypothetical protein